MPKKLRGPFEANATSPRTKASSSVLLSMKQLVERRWNGRRKVKSANLFSTLPWQQHLWYPRASRSSHSSVAAAASRTVFSKSQLQLFVL